MQLLSQSAAQLVPPLPIPAERASALRLFWGYLGRRWLQYLLGGLLVGLTCVTEVLFPKILQWIIDGLSGAPIPEVFSKPSFERGLYWLWGGLVLVWLVQGVSRRYWRIFLGRENSYVEVSLRASLWQRVCLLPSSRLQADLSLGAIMNLSASDVKTARQILGWSLLSLFDMLFLGSFALLAMASIDFELTLYALLVLIPFAFVMRSLQTKEHRQHLRAQQCLTEYSDLASQAIASIKLQKITVSESLWRARCDQSAGSYRDARAEVLNTNLLSYLLMGTAGVLAYAVLFWLGISRLQQEQISVGEFIALQSYLLLLQGPLAEAGYLLSEYQRGFASLKRIAEALRAEPDPYLLGTGEAQHALPAQASEPALLEARILCIRRADRSIVRDFSFVLQPGQWLGIQGRIGSGKSLLLDVLAGIEPASAGEVLLQGQRLSALSHQQRAAMISLVPQRPFLFATSIRENLLLDYEASDQELWQVLRWAALEDEVRALPQGLESRLGEWGITLSGGQKQRLTIARALLRRPPILLLDDCLSAVDTRTEEVILGHLRSALAKTSVIWVAHRASTLRFCSQVLELS
jgi:ATP-binding cassette subfamily B multidrug efflux pump